MTNKIKALYKANGGVPKIAKLMGLTPATLHSWSYKGRVPLAQINDLARAVCVDPLVLLPLAGSAIESKKEDAKPAATLPTLIRVKNGDLTLEGASALLDMPLHPLKVTFELNRDRLELLLDTLTKFRRRQMSAVGASGVLGCSRTEVYRLAKEYGLPQLPRPEKPAKSTGYKANSKSNLEAAFQAIAGAVQITKLSKAEHGVAPRTVDRFVEKLINPLTLNELAHWPLSARSALTYELRGRHFGTVLRWFEYANTFHIVFADERKLPAVTDWRQATVVEMLVHVLMERLSLEEVARERGGDPRVIEQLFDRTLSVLGTTYGALKRMSPDQLSPGHQLMVVDILLGMLAQQRRPKNVVYKKTQLPLDNLKALKLPDLSKFK